jgi:hypothetical protein
MSVVSSAGSLVVVPASPIFWCSNAISDAALAMALLLLLRPYRRSWFVLGLIFQGVAFLLDGVQMELYGAHPSFGPPGHAITSVVLLCVVAGKAAWEHRENAFGLSAGRC